MRGVVACLNVKEEVMDAVLPGLYASAPGALPFDRSLAIRSFLVQRDRGNLLVYRGNALVHHVDEVRALGGVSRQYLNHRHEASPACTWVAQTYEAPLFVHREEAESVSEAAELGALFFERHVLDGDFEVIPTPGHTPGATAYLWDSGEHRVLFTGDTIYFREGEWTAAVLGSSDRDRYLESLQLLRDLDFDVVVPWAATAGEPYVEHVDASEARRRIDAMLVRVARGASA
jgi:hypothetical protein